mmetsp:Transcript_22362/g.53654  ORF Transcript_22362/g.53654 Transcript_22362/m.53654 type:complete len:464 (-) Transcript_22362:240-1631(-)
MCSLLPILRRHLLRNLVLERSHLGFEHVALLLQRLLAPPELVAHAGDDGLHVLRRRPRLLQLGCRLLEQLRSFRKTLLHLPEPPLHEEGLALGSRARLLGLVHAALERGELSDPLLAHRQHPRQLHALLFALVEFLGHRFRAVPRICRLGAGVDELLVLRLVVRLQALQLRRHGAELHHVRRDPVPLVRHLRHLPRELGGERVAGLGLGVQRRSLLARRAQLRRHVFLHFRCLLVCRAQLRRHVLLHFRCLLACSAQLRHHVLLHFRCLLESHALARARLSQVLLHLAQRPRPALRGRLGVGLPGAHPRELLRVVALHRAQLLSVLRLEARDVLLNRRVQRRLLGSDPGSDFGSEPGPELGLLARHAGAEYDVLVLQRPDLVVEGVPLGRALAPLGARLRGALAHALHLARVRLAKLRQLGGERGAELVHLDRARVQRLRLPAHARQEVLNAGFALAVPRAAV